jgi:hypothetical protein
MLQAPSVIDGGLRRRERTAAGRSAGRVLLPRSSRRASERRSRSHWRRSTRPDRARSALRRTIGFAQEQAPRRLRRGGAACPATHPSRCRFHRRGRERLACGFACFRGRTPRANTDTITPLVPRDCSSAVDDARRLQRGFGLDPQLALTRSRNPLMGVIRQPDRAKVRRRLPEFLLPSILLVWCPLPPPRRRGSSGPSTPTSPSAAMRARPRLTPWMPPARKRSRRPAWGRCPMFSMLLHGR